MQYRLSGFSSGTTRSLTGILLAFSWCHMITKDSNDDIDRVRAEKSVEGPSQSNQVRPPQKAKPHKSGIAPPPKPQIRPKEEPKK